MVEINLMRLTRCNYNMVIHVILNYMDQCSFVLYRHYCKWQIGVKGLKKFHIPNYNEPVLIFNRLANFRHFIGYFWKQTFHRISKVILRITIILILIFLYQLIANSYCCNSSNAQVVSIPLPLTIFLSSRNT